MKDISVYIIVYNEEKRIENFIKSFLWSDDVVISIRTSTNDNTRKIAEKYPVRIVDNPYINMQEEGSLEFEQNQIASLKNEWVMFITASDLIHPNLVKELLRLINDETFNYDIIKGPGNRYALGINNKRSPWFAGYNRWPVAYKKKSITLTNKVHEEIRFDSDKIYTIPVKKNKQHEGFFHLSHRSADSAVESAVRYCKIGEAVKYDDENIALRQSFKDVVKALIKVTLREKTWLLGWDGIAIACDYLIYYMMKYLFLWDKYRNNAGKTYENIAGKILKEWHAENNRTN